MALQLNYESWKRERFLYSGAYFDTASAPVDGIHSMRTSESQLTLDFLASGFSDPEPKARSFLVVLSGAVAKQTRAVASAPFFSGLGTAGGVRLPLLSVSDPTLALDPELTLAWYAGNSLTTNLLAIIARNIDRVATATGLYPILIGGSGGGYAAINISARLESEATTIVWNPQTSIGGYDASAARRYIEVAYPEIEFPSENPSTQREFQEFLDNAIDPTRHRLPPVVSIDTRHKIIFLQDRTDTFHMSRHAGPWLNTAEFEALGPNTYQNSAGNILFFVGNWGKGHAPAPGHLISELILSANSGTALSQIGIQRLAKSRYSPNDTFTWLAVRPPMNNDIAITHKKNGDTVQLSFEISPSLGKTIDFEYACYLYERNKIVARSGYRKTPDFSFSGILGNTPLTARLYLRDQLGSIKAVSKKL